MGDEPPSPTAGPQVVTGDEQDDVEVDLAALAALVRTALAGEGVPVHAEVNLLLVDEAAIAELNDQHLGGTGPTDVLSFPIDGPSLDLGVASLGAHAASLGAHAASLGAHAASLGAHAAAGDAGTVSRAHLDEVLVGDVVICPAVARTNAERHGTSLEDELRLLAVHGALHLLGHDHADAVGAEAMRERELRYAGRSGATEPELSTTTEAER